MTTRRPRIVIKPNFRPTPKTATKPKVIPVPPSDTSVGKARQAVEDEDHTLSGASVRLSDRGKARQAVEDEDHTLSGASDSSKAKRVVNKSTDQLRKTADVVDGTSVGLSAHEAEHVNQVVVHKASQDSVLATREITQPEPSKGRDQLTSSSFPQYQTIVHPQSKDPVTFWPPPAVTPTNMAPKPTSGLSIPPAHVAHDFVKTAAEVGPAASTTNQEKVHSREPSELGDKSSYVSDAVSLEEERKGEMDEDTLVKKSRTRRVRKTRTETLPSREKSPDRQKMKMSDLLFWNPQQNYFPKKSQPNKTDVTRKAESAASSHVTITVEEAEEDSNESSSLPAPQVMIGPDGSVMINTESLLISTKNPEDSKARLDMVEEDDDNVYLNTNSYRRTKKAKLWTDIETQKFFLGLSMCGTDFSLLTGLLPHRSRRDLKNKFRREERRNRPLIDKALANKQKFDPAPFEWTLEEKGKKVVKPEVKRKVKKEAEADKKHVKVPVKRQKKGKKVESDDQEEEDWDPQYDEEDVENEGSGEDSEVFAQHPLIKHKRLASTGVKREPVLSESSKTSTSKVAMTTENAATSTRNVVVQVGQHPKPGQPKSQWATGQGVIGDKQSPHDGAASTSTMQNSTSASSTQSVLDALPGSTQIQIEMDGVQHPVSGVLIAPHMVPLIAPQLGIESTQPGTQVLLVQEETATGSLVHVYIIPEGEAPIPSTSSKVSEDSTDSTSVASTSNNGQDLTSISSI